MRQRGFSQLSALPREGEDARLRQVGGERQRGGRREDSAGTGSEAASAQLRAVLPNARQQRRRRLAGALVFSAEKANKAKKKPSDRFESM